MPRIEPCFREDSTVSNPRCTVIQKTQYWALSRHKHTSTDLTEIHLLWNIKILLSGTPGSQCPFSLWDAESVLLSGEHTVPGMKDEDQSKPFRFLESDIIFPCRLFLAGRGLWLLTDCILLVHLSGKMAGSSFLDHSLWSVVVTNRALIAILMNFTCG